MFLTRKHPSSSMPGFYCFKSSSIPSVFESHLSPSKQGPASCKLDLKDLDWDLDSDLDLDLDLDLTASMINLHLSPQEGQDSQIALRGMKLVDDRRKPTYHFRSFFRAGSRACQRRERSTYVSDRIPRMLSRLRRVLITYSGV
nr:hypothetical protein CFP56_68316 [Quercus suber]